MVVLHVKFEFHSNQDTLTYFTAKNRSKSFICIHGLKTLRPRQNGCHLPNDIFKYIFLNEKKNVWISLKISLKCVPEVRINNIPALVLIMAWRRPGAKPLSEPMMASSPTHICVTRPQWVKNHIEASDLVHTLILWASWSLLIFIMVGQFLALWQTKTLERGCY